MEERQYDLIFICRPDTPEADVDKVIATLESTATDKGAKVESVAKWGRKRMAYRVQKLHEGYFVYMVIKTTHGEVVKELERRLKVADPVIKYLTVRLDEELKRQEKLKPSMLPSESPGMSPAMTGTIAVRMARPVRRPEQLRIRAIQTGIRPNLPVRE